jgi:DNA-binding transcriptional MerR regulator
MLTVKQLSRLTGITTRTLHYYDEIGLLKPTRIGANGYRLYDEAAQLRLQQILLYRALDVPLAAIRAMMGQDDFDIMAALLSHREALSQQAKRLHGLISTVDDTIRHLKGQTKMNSAQLFEGLSPAQEQAYAAEAEQRYDAATVRASQRRWQEYGKDRQAAILAEGNAIYAAIAAAMPQGADSAAVQALVQRWRDHIGYFWVPQLAQLEGLARSYSEDARFKANFDKVQPGLAEFMLHAVQHYMRRQAA